MRIACVGDIAFDSYPNEGRVFLGGSSFNQAVHLAQLGHEVTLVSRISPQDRDIAEHYLEKKQVGSGLRTRAGQTACCEIIVRAGERFFTSFRPGVLKDFCLVDEELRGLERQDAIVLSLFYGVEQAFESVLKLQFSGIRVADFSEDYEGDGVLPLNQLMKSLSYLNIAFVATNHTDPSGLQSLADQFKTTLLVATLGSQGSRAWHGNEQYQGMAIPTNVVDTTGAGDAFQAALLSAYLKGESIEKALHAAHLYAAKIVTHLGALEGCELPGRYDHACE